MTFLDVLPILIIVLIVGGVCFYLYKQKKRGRKCIGCPYCDACSSAKSGSGCCQGSKEKENKSLHN